MEVWVLTFYFAGEYFPLWVILKNFISRGCCLFPEMCFLLTRLHGFCSLLCGVPWVLIAGVLAELPDSQGQAFLKLCIDSRTEKHTRDMVFLKEFTASWYHLAPKGSQWCPTLLDRGGLWKLLFLLVALGFILSPLFPSSSKSLLNPMQGRHTGWGSWHS